MISLNNDQLQEFAELWEKIEREQGFNGTFDMNACLKSVNDIGFRKNNRVLTGVLFSAPTTPSTQASGAVAPVWRLNASVGMYSIGGYKNIVSNPNNLVDAIMGDFDAVTQMPVLTVGQSIVAVAVGTMYDVSHPEWSQYGIIFGTPKTTGQEQPPSDSVIRSHIIAGGGVIFPNGYVRIAKLTLNRTADTTVTQTQDNTWRDV